MSSDLSLEFLRVVEQAAIACAHTMGQGDGHKADQAAVTAMRTTLDSVPIHGTIVIGEGERDKAPMLFIGETVGTAAKEGGGPGTAQGRHRRRPARGDQSLCHRRAECPGGARGVEPRRPSARARSLHGKARRRRELEERGQPRCAGGRQPSGHRGMPPPRRRRPGRDCARSPAPRAAHSGDPGHGGEDSSDLGWRSLRRHRRGG